jgi:hypothetical protein
VRFNDFVIKNPGSQTVWYTDPFGNKGRSTPFPGSVRQFVSNVDHKGVRSFTGPTISGNYTAAGVHAPN